MNIEARFNKGDEVFVAETSFTNKTVPCPDCIGEKTWTVVFPSGQIEQIGCQTCKPGFEPSSGRITIREWSTEVKKLTIGSIKYDDTSDNKFSYMCVETGIGSGRIYYDKDIFTNLKEAEEAAEIKYQEQMKNTARNNFKTAKDIEGLLSVFGFTRSQAAQKARDFKKWMTSSKILNP